MNIKRTYIVFRNKKDGSFLVDFKSNKMTFAFGAGFTDYIEDAATMPLKNYEEQKDQFKPLAKALACEVIKVEANYSLTYPNGSEVKEIKKEKDDIGGFENFLESMSKMLEENSDD